MKWKALAVAGTLAGLLVTAVVRADDKEKARELFREAAQLMESAKIHHAVGARLLDVAGAEEEGADQERHRSHQLESQARQLEKSGDANRTKAVILRARAHKAHERAELDESQEKALRARIAREDAARRDQQEASSKLSAAAKLEVDANEKGRLEVEATLILNQSNEDVNAENARKARLASLAADAKQQRELAAAWREEAHKLDPTDGAGGVPIAADATGDKAKARELYHEAWKLQESARVHHGVSLRMLELAAAEEEIADRERHKAHQLDSQARALEKGGDANRTKAALLRAWAQKAGEKAELDELQARNLRNRIAREEASRKDQQAAAEKLKAAANLEVDANEKGRLNIEVTLISNQAQEDSTQDAERRSRMDSLEAEAKNLRAQAIKWLEEAHRLDPTDGRR